MEQRANFDMKYIIKQNIERVWDLFGIQKCLFSTTVIPIINAKY